MKSTFFYLLILLFVVSCGEPRLPETLSPHQIPEATKALNSSFVSELHSWETKYISEIASDGHQIILAYQGDSYTKAIPLLNGQNSVPVTTTSFNFRTGQLHETRQGIQTRSETENSQTIQLPDTLPALRAVRAGNYIISTGLYDQGRYLLYDLDTKTGNFYLSYPDHPIYPNLREDTKAILYASTVLKVHPDHHHFVCGDMYSGNLEFCRITGAHIDRVQSYCYHHPRVYINEDSIPDVAYSRDNRLGFTDITVTSDKVYALYSGHTHRANRKTFQQCRKLLVYDWEGNLLKTYALDRPLTQITIDTHENSIYAIGHEPTTCLVKIPLENE